MSDRDRERNKQVQEVMGCDGTQANEIIDFMDRNDRNPEWSEIDMKSLKSHLRGVVKEMSERRQKIQTLMSVKDFPLKSTEDEWWETTR